MIWKTFKGLRHPFFGHRRRTPSQQPPQPRSHFGRVGCLECGSSIRFSQSGMCIVWITQWHGHVLYFRHCTLQPLQQICTTTAEDTVCKIQTQYRMPWAGHRWYHIQTATLRRCNINKQTRLSELPGSATVPIVQELGNARIATNPQFQTTATVQSSTITSSLRVDQILFLVDLVQCYSQLKLFYLVILCTTILGAKKRPKAIAHFCACSCTTLIDDVRVIGSRLLSSHFSSTYGLHQTRLIQTIVYKYSIVKARAIEQQLSNQLERHEVSGISRQLALAIQQSFLLNCFYDFPMTGRHLYARGNYHGSIHAPQPALHQLPYQ